MHQDVEHLSFGTHNIKPFNSSCLVRCHFVIELIQQRVGPVLLDPLGQVNAHHSSPSVVTHSFPSKPLANSQIFPKTYTSAGGLSGPAMTNLLLHDLHGAVYVEIMFPML
jgi:hypothetical protein